MSPIYISTTDSGKLSIELLNEWLQLCLDDKLIDVDTFGEKQHKDFLWNTQEQAILNVLIRKKQSENLIPKDFPLFSFDNDRNFVDKNMINILQC